MQSPHKSALTAGSRWIWPVLLLVTLAPPLVASAGGAQGGNSDADAAFSDGVGTVVLNQTRSENAINSVVQITATADAYVTSNKPDTNWSGDTSLYLGYDLQQNDDGAERILLFFDLAGSVPAQAVINAAYVELYEYAATPAGDQPMGNVVRNLNSPWNASEVTWNNHEPKWDGISEQGQIDITVGWHQFPMTGLVKEWLNGTTPNNGVIMIGDERVRERQRMFYSLNAGNAFPPRLVIDYTVSLDTIPPNVVVDALPQFVAANFNVTWSGTDAGGSGIDYYDVQYMVPGQGWQNWQTHTTATSATLYGGQNETTYQFRARGVDHAGNVQPFDGVQAETAVDAVAPTVAVNSLPPYAFYPAFDVTWQGTDNPGGSGIAHYDVQYRVNGGPWRDWRVDTLDTSAQFTGGQDKAVYEFRARGVDNVGNAQPFGYAQATTTIETAPPTSRITPFPSEVSHNDSFQVSWSGQAEPHKTILYYDVRYQLNNGPWTIWQQQTEASSATFTAAQGDGLYKFEVRAADNYGALEAFSEQSAATVIVDVRPPFVTLRIWLPLVRKS